AEQTLELVAGLPGEGGGIELEITETALLQDLETSRRRLERLREAGVRIAIDDFGTGYSSLALLPRLPIDALKIDRSFIQGLPDDRANVTLVSSIIGLARAFELEAVAEGVETAGQLEMLRAFGCNRSQGFLHGRPVPGDEIERMLLSSANGAAAIQG
ncbi:MAG TPA: EAL domain-containing protein, partial [Steroidobacteraceae bacterium]